MSHKRRLLKNLLDMHDVRIDLHYVMWIVGRPVRKEWVLYLQQKEITAQYKWYLNDIRNRQQAHYQQVSLSQEYSKTVESNLRSPAWTSLNGFSVISDEVYTITRSLLRSTPFQVTMRLPAMTCKHQSSTQVIISGKVYIKLDWTILLYKTV